MKKLITMVLLIGLILGLVGCGKGGSASSQQASQLAVSKATSEASGKSKLGDEKLTLKIVGCGPFNATGPDGTVNAVSGAELPGYNMIVDAWKAEHPNVTLEIEDYPWDNWQASIQTAVLGGGVDVIMHGATLTDLVVPLEDYIKADPEFDSKRLAYDGRRSESLGSLEKSHITGVPVTLAPMVVLLNKDILAHYGVTLPDKDWDWNDLLEIAKTCTGKDPSTGEQTYGIQVYDCSSDNQLWKSFVSVGYGIGAQPTIQYGPTTKESKAVYNDDNAMKIWNFLGELSKYTSPADREGVDVSVPESDFNIAIYFTEGPSTSHDSLKAAGVLDKYAALNLPVVTSGELKGEVTPYCGDTNLAICKTSEHKDWAWEFIKFSCTNEAALKYYIAAQGVANNSDSYSKLDELWPKDWVEAVRNDLKKIPDTYSAGSGMYSNNISFGNLNVSIGSAMRTLLMGTGTPKSAAASVQKVIDEYIASLP